MKNTARDIEETLRAVNGEVSGALASIAREVFDFEKFPFSFMVKAVRARFTLLMAGALGAGA